MPLWRHQVEAKNALRMLVEANVIENVWGGCAISDREPCGPEVRLWLRTRVLALLAGTRRPATCSR